MFWFSNFSQGGSEARSHEAQVIIVNVTKPGITWERGLWVEDYFYANWGWETGPPWVVLIPDCVRGH